MDPRELSVPERHQLRVARDTLKMTDAMVRVMGGMTKEEAREIVRRLTGRAPRENPRHYGDLLKGNPPERRWFPGAIALGVTKDARTWYAHRIETDIGWDFPTLQHLFPFPIERVRTFGDTLVRIKFMPGDHRFKLKTDRGWTKPLPLSTRLSPEEIDAAAGFAITGVVRSGAPI